MMRGDEPQTVHVAASVILSAVRDVLWVVGSFAVIAMMAEHLHGRARKIDPLPSIHP
jgi:hypothetical protein